MSQSSDDVIKTLRQRQLEVMRDESNDIIDIRDARRNITILDSLFPRISIESIETENGEITALILNTKTLSIFQPIADELILIKSRIFARIKLPSKDIANVNIISSQKITLPLIEAPTGRIFHTIKVELN